MPISTVPTMTDAAGQSLGPGNTVAFADSSQVPVAQRIAKVTGVRAVEGPGAEPCFLAELDLDGAARTARPCEIVRIAPVRAILVP